MKTVNEAIRSLRSVRRFSDQPLPPEVVGDILNAGRLSGSAKNRQPWHFVAVQRRETLVELSQCGEWAGHLAGAALGVALTTEDPQQRIVVPFDLGRAAQNMMLLAWSQGIASVMATIYQPERVRAALNIPATYTVPWCISFGYPAEAARPPRRSGRRQADEVIHYEGW